MKKILYTLICLLCFVQPRVFAHFDNTCENDMATHKYADLSANSIKFSPEATSQVIQLSNGKNYTFTETCKDYNDPNTPPTIVITANGLGTIHGTFIPITTTSPLLHVTGALNADLQQIG